MAELTWQQMIEQLAAKALLHVVRHDSGMYSCNAIYHGKKLSAYAMQAEIRLRYMPTGAVRVVCWGWVNYKAVCKREGLDWRQCVYVVRADDLDGAIGKRVVVDDSYKDLANPNRVEIAKALADIS